MRDYFLSIFALAAIAGCGSTPPPQQQMDAAIDLATFHPDIATPMKTGCNGYVACLNNCANGDTACANQCKANTTANGLNVYNKALFCGQEYCLGANDMGPGACMLSADMTMLIDKTGGPANGCGDCLNNALAALFAQTCNPANSPDCNPAQCTASYTACANSTP